MSSFYLFMHEKNALQILLQAERNLLIDFNII